MLPTIVKSLLEQRISATTIDCWTIRAARFHLNVVDEAEYHWEKSCFGVMMVVPGVDLCLDGSPEHGEVWSPVNETQMEEKVPLLQMRQEKIYSC